MALPLLLFADVFAVLFYRRQADWRLILRFLPWTLAGVVAGWLVLGRLGDRQTVRLVAGLILVFALLHLGLRCSREPGPETGPPRQALTGALGVCAGFATLVANAAGPLFSLYLLAARVPKLAFLGSTAVFFLVLNCAKVPFLAQLGLINARSLALDLRIAPFVLVGVCLGPMALKTIKHSVFEAITLVFAVLAAVWLMCR